MSSARSARVLTLFNYDWDAAGFARAAGSLHLEHAGFDLFTFPSNVQLAFFDMERFVDRLARRAPRRRWSAVVSQHEQFGALAAALLAERLGLPGTPVRAVIACQHKAHARRVLDRVAPQANVAWQELDAAYGEPIPEGCRYPAFVKPVKAAFSVLARTVRSRDELQAHTRFGAWERWVIRHLVEPFERVARARIPEIGTAHRMLLEEPVQAAQYNLDGYVFNGEVHALGIVDSVMYPGTQAFMRFDYPGRGPAGLRERALAVARVFLRAVGFTHGLFNMEFFHDPVTGRLAVIEFNPRMASQFSDLYLRVDGIDLHRLALALAFGRNPVTVPRRDPTAGAASSFVYRSFDPAFAPHEPDPLQRLRLHQQFPDALLLEFPKDAAGRRRDFKWLDSHRYGVMHLGGRDERDLRLRCERASAILGWPAPYAELASAACPTPGWPVPSLTEIR